MCFEAHCHLTSHRLLCVHSALPQEKLSVAQNDYVRALAALKSTASELEGLFGRVQGTEKQTAGERAGLPRGCC